MIDYAKIFKETIENNFYEDAKDIKESFPYIYSPWCTFALVIDKEYRDNLNWIKGQAIAYTQEIARMNKYSRLKSIDIDVYETDDKIHKELPRGLFVLEGKIEFTK